MNTSPYTGRTNNIASNTLMILGAIFFLIAFSNNFTRYHVHPTWCASIGFILTVIGNYFTYYYVRHTLPAQENPSKFIYWRTSAVPAAATIIWLYALWHLAPFARLDAASIRSECIHLAFAGILYGVSWLPPYLRNTQLNIKSITVYIMNNAIMAIAILVALAYNI